MFNRRLSLLAVIIFLAGAVTCAAIYFCCPWRSSPGSKIKRIIFVTIDTLRADHLGAFGYPRKISPFIDSLAESGAIFTKAFSAAPHTSPSHASMFTSLFPFQHNLLRNQETLDPALFNIKKFNDQNGYKSLAFPAVKFLEGKVGFPFEDGITNATDKNFKKFWYRSASNVVDNVLAWLDKDASKKSLFLWLHFYDVHEWAGKKNIPKEYLEKVKAFSQEEHLDFLVKNHNTPISFFGSKEKTLKAINGYDARIMYVDDQLSRLSKYLADHEMSADTLWVITSDHGEGLGNHNYKGHGQFLYQEQLHVPLIFNLPGKIAAQRVEHLVRTVDIFPTIAELLGKSIDKDTHKIEGVSLHPLLTNDLSAAPIIPYSFAERRPKDMVSFRRAWEDGEIYSLHDLANKYIEHSNGLDEFYDLANDPFEETNIEQKNTAALKEIKSVLSKIFDPSKRIQNEQENISDSPEELEELKSLGYL